MQNECRGLRRRILLVAFLAALLLVLPGCGAATGSDAQAGDQEQAEEQAQEETDIEEAYQEALEAEEEEDLSEGSGGGGLQVGDEAPEFKAELAGGGTFDLEEARGQVVLLNFWALYCSPCIAEMPAFQMLYEDYGDTVQIVAVNGGDVRADVDAFREENGYEFSMAYDERYSVNMKYPTTGIPYTVIVGPDGKITATFLGAESAKVQYRKYKAAIEDAME